MVFELQVVRILGYLLLEVVNFVIFQWLLLQLRVLLVELLDELPKHVKLWALDLKLLLVCFFKLFDCLLVVCQLPLFVEALSKEQLGNWLELGNKFVG